MGKADAEFCFDAGIDQFGTCEYVPGWLCFQKAGEYWLVKPKLVLNGLGSEADFPTYLTLSGGDTSVDQGKLDTIGIIRCKLVVVCARKNSPCFRAIQKSPTAVAKSIAMNIPLSLTHLQWPRTRWSKSDYQDASVQHPSVQQNILGGRQQGYAGDELCERRPVRGQKRRSVEVRVISALSLKADIHRRVWHASEVP